MSTAPALLEGTVAFLLTDVQGSTGLLKELGDSYERVIEDHHRLIRAVGSSEGVEVRAAGDGFIWVFADPADAVAAAVGMQHALVEHAWPSGAQVFVRMSLHVGDAKVVGGDYVSVALHQSVRLNAAAHGGQIVASAAFRDSVGERLPEFTGLTTCGSYVIRDFDGPVEVFEVRHPDLPSGFPPLRVPSAAVHNLTPNRTSFVGRLFDVGEITKLLDIAGVASLVGPGGIGKTRLACEAGRAVAGRYAAGVWFVPLDGLTDPALLVETINRHLVIAEEATADPFALLVQRLSGEPCLLIVDNCEHVIDEVAETIAELIDACPALSVLATSREPLGIAAEHVYRVDPLPVPIAGAAAEDPTSSAAVELFVQRARQSKRDFVLGSGDVDAVAEICRLLDGIPLALELVAARVGSSQIAELRDELVAAGALDASRRGGESRHRTMRRTIAWSYDRLEADARAAFATLAVFRGGFTTEAAAHVLASTAHDVDVQSSLHELAARSVVEPQPDHDPPRFRMLEPVRQFAADVLGDATSAATLAHARWTASFCERGDGELRGPDQSVWLHRFEAELDNIRAAFDAAIESRDGTLAATIASGSQTFCLFRGYRREAIERCTQALALEQTDEQRASVLNSRGHLLLPMGETQRAEDDFDEVVRIFDALGRPEEAIGALTGRAQAAYFRGEFAEARRGYARVIEASRRAGRADLLAQALADAGNLAIAANELDVARTLAEEALDLFLSVGGGPPAVSCLLILAQVAGLVGDGPLSKEHHERALQLAIDCGYDGGRAGAELGMAWTALHEGDHERAAALARSARTLFDRLGDQRSAATAAICVGEAAMRSGDVALATSEHCDALARATSAGATDVVQRVFYVFGRALCTTLHAATGVQLLAAARRLADDGLLAWEQAERAIGLEEGLASARASIGPRFDAAWTEGYDGGVEASIALIRSLMP